MELDFSEKFAKKMDRDDQLNSLRNLFYFPKFKNKDCIYFNGNSLGLQPKDSKLILNKEFEDWANMGVDGHFKAKTPWISYHKIFTNSISNLLGAKNEEVIVMNSLTVNLHLLFSSFYRPTKDRYKILCESNLFPSDRFVIESQIKFHGFDIDDALIAVTPRKGEYIIREEDIVEKIKNNSGQISLVFLGGVNYYTGQVFDMQMISRYARKYGAKIGFDLAHAIGNVKLKLNEWGVDFAAWCSYKYLNSGPGNVGGAYINKKYHKKDLFRLAGWWGHKEKSRFKMGENFHPILTAEAWQLSNAPIFGMSVHKVALDIFDEIGIEKLILKSKKLTNYLEYVINLLFDESKKFNAKIITPSQSEKRGCQLSVLINHNADILFKNISNLGVKIDYREPNVLRIAPVPLYNSFYDIYLFGEKLKLCL
ncbi:MAG: kynureninase [Flavobacteriales bacterium]|nr:kynureninase [Flavobacteriales bacterium]|tara:strand:+ start:7500 stop:8768 length:1269 start_codon:yes stop_codon:yes gene_type:complete